MKIRYYIVSKIFVSMVVEQLREELYSIALRKLDMERELKVMAGFISTLKKELECRQV